MNNYLPKILLYVITAIIMNSCNQCECKVDLWKDDSKEKLNKFKEVYAEIKKHEQFFKREKHDNLYGKDQLYFDADDLRRFEKVHDLKLPKLNQWFILTNNKEQSNSYIYFDGEHLQANYLKCFWNFFIYEYDYSASLYYSPTGIRPSFTKHKKSIVELRDSLSFGDNWFYILTRCEGCGR